MKLVNFKLQSSIEQLAENKSKDHFKEYLQSILEDDSKPYFQRCDYVALSMNETKSKIDCLSTDIKELQNLKKRYSESLNIAKELTADIFKSNGIDRIDGNIVSSLTLTKATTKTMDTVSILDAKAVMGMGHLKFEPDTESIINAMKTKEGRKELEQYVSLISITTTTPAKVKINTKRTPSNTITVNVDEILNITHNEAA